MNRRVVLWIFPVTAAIAVSVLVYSKLPAKANTEPVHAADAIRMWSTDKPVDREHELKALESSLKQNPDHAPILIRMAQVSMEMGKTADAVNHLREAVRVDPKNHEARLELGRALFDTGDVDGAIRETEQLLQLDPSNLDGMYNMGAIYGNLGREDQARKYWRMVVAISPDSDSGRRSKDALKQIGELSTQK